MSDAVAIDGAILAAALRYAGLGYRVFPCAPGEKRPLTKHGFKDATSDVEQIRRWWSEMPNANLGIATDGLVVVDVDGADNPWLESESARAEDLFVAPASITPRGGRHHWFRQPTGKTWRCSASKLAPHVDVRADGGYVVVPPSRVGGASYAWIEGHLLDRAIDALPEPPDWLCDQLDALHAPKVSTNAPKSRDTRVASVVEPCVPIPEGQRNTTLASFAGKLRHGGLNANEMLTVLNRINRERCAPPLPDDEVERIVDSISRYPSGGAVAQLDVVAAAVDRHEEPVEPAEPSPDELGPTPSSLLRMPGFVDAVVEHTLDTAPYPEPVLAFAGALSLQAVLAGRKVRDEMDNRTNLFVVGLANSGVGKDHARKINARVLHAAGVAERLGNSFASGEGIEDRLAEQPASLFQVDEIDGLLLRIAQAKDARFESIVSVLLQMHSSASSVYVLRAKAGRERAVIDQPCLCMFGTAIPNAFYGAMPKRLLSNGWLARLLVLECGKRSQGRDSVYRPIPEAIAATAGWWAEFVPGGCDRSPNPRTVSATPEAKEVFAAMRSRFDGAYAACESAGDDAGMAVWARAYEKARRLALIWACSASPHEPRIDAAAATWAEAFVDDQTRRMLQMAKRHAQESEFDGKRKRCLDALERWRRSNGEAWMPFWRLSRALPWPAREHDEVRETLVNQRLIEVRSVTTAGRPAVSYRLRPGGAS